MILRKLCKQNVKNRLVNTTRHPKIKRYVTIAKCSENQFSIFFHTSVYFKLFVLFYKRISQYEWRIKFNNAEFLATMSGNIINNKVNS